MYRRILVPLDGTACSEAALPHAQALAEKFGSELILMRVVEPTPLPTPVTTMAPMDGGLWAAYPPGISEVEETREEIAEEYIEETAERIGRGRPITTEVEWGGAAHEIAECAHEHRADLIIIGAHERSGWERFLLGSTSESLLHQTDIPVLIVKYHEPHREEAAAG
ncbi:MAG: universal stress protein [Armatimonadetes bacterium]|nr:universal stress protein [Armatimonadota bacterium]